MRRIGSTLMLLGISTCTDVPCVTGTSPQFVESIVPMYRKSGLIALALGVLAVWLLVFTPFETELRRYTRDDDGQRVKATLVCPDPWGLLFEDAEADGKYHIDQEECVKGARTLFTGGVLATLLALGLGIRGLIRGPHPPIVHLRPLSEVFPDLVDANSG